MIKKEFKTGTFYNADCFSIFPVLNKIPKMILTDIPYGEVNRKSSGLRNLNKGKADEVCFELKKLIDEFSKNVSETVYCFCGIDQISEITIELKKNKFSTRLGQWEKSNPSPMNGNRIWLSGSEFCVFGRKAKSTFNRHCEKPIWKYPVGQNKIHDTQKPIKLFEYLIQSSSDKEDLILDPFAGSGTTAIAAINTNRRWICIERDPEYFEKACARIEAAEVLL